jgi:hypothetical protein
MKRIAILVIASTKQPLYIHYIKTYWAELIRRTNTEKSNIDVFLLFEHETDLSEFESLRKNIIQDRDIDFSLLCKPEYQSPIIPGILSKTIYALEQLQGEYDVFFRTNLSSVIKISAFENFVQTKVDICYSGTYVWTDALRQDLLYHDKIGPDKSIKSLAELDNFQGNTFISGSNYFLNAAEAKSLITRKGEIRYDIVDDVSVGLMFSRHEVLPHFTLCVLPDRSIADIINAIRQSNASHVRLQLFPLDFAKSLWKELKVSDIW